MRSRVILVAVALALCAAATPAIATGHSDANRRLVEALRRPRQALDPVLANLAADRLVREVGPLLPGQVELPPVPLGFALTGDQLARLDITGTLLANQQVDAFLARLRGRGIELGDSRFSVYTLPSVQEAIDAAPGSELDSAGGPLASALVVPTGTVVELVGAVWDGGQLQVKTTVSSSPPTSSGAVGRIRPFATAAPGSPWIYTGPSMKCIHRTQNNTAWYDPCQWFLLLDPAVDGDPTRDYWASQYYGSGKGKGIWTLNRLEADGRRKPGSAAQEWVDWDPGADAAGGNCAPQTVSVSYAGFGVSIQKNRCDTWDIDKGAEAADFANWWRGHARRKERETAAEVLTRLRAGEQPRGLFDFDYYANP
ncbi:MAG: hypothetical protein ACRDZ3_09460 [Acidimicrobiia bacterium]